MCNIKEMINRIYRKIKNFCFSKDTIKRLKAKEHKEKKDLYLEYVKNSYETKRMPNPTSLLKVSFQQI